MKEVVDFLREGKVLYLATSGVDGKPKVRPFGFMREEKGKLYFCTSNRKKVFEELRRQPAVEFCCMGEGSRCMRLPGKAVFDTDPALKARVLDSNEMVKSIYKSADNPIFEVFHLVDAEAVIADFSGTPPKTIALRG